MSKAIHLFLIILLFCSCRNQQKEYNFDFEGETDMVGFPSQWDYQSDDEAFTITTDYTEKYKGNASAKITYGVTPHKNSLAAIIRRIPADTTGKELELRAYMKFKSVYKVGLVLETEDEAGISIDWDTAMYNTGYSFTADWKEYTVKIPISKKAKDIAIGAFLLSGGDLWIDDMRLYMDGKPYFFDKNIYQKDEK